MLPHSKVLVAQELAVRLPPPPQKKTPDIKSSVLILVAVLTGSTAYVKHLRAAPSTIVVVIVTDLDAAALFLTAREAAADTAHTIAAGIFFAGGHALTAANDSGGKHRTDEQ